VPNGKNLLADSLGQELLAYRDGELAWKGFVNNVTENDNGIELVGRGDFHRLEYIEDFNEVFSASSFDKWIEVSAENSKYYPSLTTIQGLDIWVDADVQGNIIDSPIYVINSKTANRSYVIDQYVSAAPANKKYETDYSYVQMYTLFDSNKFKSSFVTTSGQVSMFFVIDNDKSGNNSGTIIDMGTNSNGFRVWLNRDSESYNFTTEAYYYDSDLEEYVYISPRYDSGGNVVTGGWPYSFNGNVYNEFGDLLYTGELYTQDGTPLIDFAEYYSYPQINFKSSGQFLKSTQRLSDGLSIVFIVFNRSTGVVEIKVDDNALTSAVRTIGTAPTTESSIGGTYSTNPYGPGDALYKLSEFLFYSRLITGNDFTTIFNYLNAKYKGTSHKIADDDFYNLVVVPRGTTINKINVDFENRAYMTIPNGSTFSLNDSSIVTLKFPETVTTDMLFNFAEFEYNIPQGFVLSIFAYTENGEILRLLGYYNTSNSYVYPNILTNINTYQTDVRIKQLMICITFAGYNYYDGVTPFYSFTNTQSDNYYYVNIKYFRSQIDPFIGKVKGTKANAMTYQILGFGNVPENYDSSVETKVTDFIIYADPSVPIYQGSLLYLILTYTISSTEYKDFGIFRVKRIEDSTYSGNPAIAIYIDLLNDYYQTIEFYNPLIEFNIVKLPTSEVVKYINNAYLSGYTQIIKDTTDDLSNLSFENVNALNAIQELADNLDFKFYVTGGKVFFTKDPNQTYYLNQDSKNISQSFDNVYTNIRTRYTSIYQFSAVTKYVRPSERYNVVKSKTIEQGTLSRSLATVVAETVASEDISSIVKVIPQSGDLYNEYGAIVRDPQINSAVVLKNVVPELIGLGDKTYYLSQIKYDFATGKYEYVIDEPELTFELILERTSGQ
jgi:hypothetical protein